MTAVLELSAEAGVPSLTLAKILERAGTGHRTFHRHFAGVDEAVAATYEDRANAVIEAVLERGLSAQSWEAGFRAALRWIVEWASGEPAAARLLLAEYRHLAQTFELHERGVARLAQTVDLGRREIPAERQPPPMTANLAIGAIESQLAARVQGGRTSELAEIEPALCYFGVLLYRGRETAQREFD